jgi:hypothetical protein
VAALNTVTLTWTIADLTLSGLPGRLTLVPTSLLQDAPNDLIVPVTPYSVTFTSGSGHLEGIVACDNSQIVPAPGYWAYLLTVTYPVLPGSTEGGQAIIGPEPVFINYASGAVQDLSSLVEVAAPGAYTPYMLAPSGTPTAGQVPEASGVGQASAWATLSSGGGSGSIDGGSPDGGLLPAAVIDGGSPDGGRYPAGVIDGGGP